MRPIPIPDTHPRWHPSALTKVLAAPNGNLMDDHIRPVEVIIDAKEETGPCFRVLWALDEAERHAIAEGGVIELIVMANGLPPHAMVVYPPLELNASRPV